MEEDDFQNGDSGASKTFPMQCSALRKNAHVVIKGRPCKIADMMTAKTGKHGHAKIHLIAFDIFSGKRYEDICPSTHNIDVPNVSRKEYSLVNISHDHYCSIMDDAGLLRSDLKLPDGDQGHEIKNIFGKDKEICVTVLKAMGYEMIVSHKMVSRK